MHPVKIILFAALTAVLVLPGRAAGNANDLERVLRQLDTAARAFHSATADFEADSVMTDPVPDTDVQKGTVFYERRGTNFQMAAHIRETNNRPSAKMYTYAEGRLRLFEPAVNRVTSIAKASDYSSYILLGFGASGTELAERWDITYLGSETLDNVKTEKLELVAKDPSVRKYVPKVTIWVDPARAVSLQQIIDEGSGQYRKCIYFNIRMNQPLPGDAFAFKTNAQTVYENR